MQGLFIKQGDGILRAAVVLWRAAEGRGVHFEAWRVAVGQFYKVIKEEEREGESNQSSAWLHRGEWPIRAQSELFSEGRKKKRKSHVQTYGAQLIKGLAWAAKVPLKKIMTSRLFQHDGSSFTSWISCGSSLNI